MKQKRKPVVGERLFSLNVGFRRGPKQELTPVVVAKVGRKYFTTHRAEGPYPDEMEFHIDSWRQKTEYAKSAVLYESPQQWEDEKEQMLLNSQLREVFSSFVCTLPLEALRKIHGVVVEYRKEKESQ